MRIAVAGGTGWTGRLVVEALRAQGDEPVVLARSVGVDLVSGAGLSGKLDGVDAVIDVTNVVTTRASRAIKFFQAVTSNLLAAERAAGIGHHVALSIVGIDRVDYGYYLGKRAQEALVLDARQTATVLRATQFHEFAAQMLERPGPIVIAPKMRCQPVALVEVASHLVELAHRQPQGMTPELAGPEQLQMPDLIRQLSRARHGRRPVLPVGLPGAIGRGFTGGALLPTDPGPRGTITFSTWLADQATT